MDDQMFDLELFRQVPGSVAARPPPVPQPETASDPRFLRGPIPLAWLAAAGRLPTRALHVAVALAFLAGVSKTRVELKVSPKLMSDFGLDRFARYRALRDLEEAGLVTVVSQAPGRCPLVTLLWDRGSASSASPGRDGSP